MNIQLPRLGDAGHSSPTSSRSQMKRSLVSILYILALFLPHVVLADDPDSSDKGHAAAGLGEVVARQLQEMGGEWEIHEAQLRGAPLPNDQFESLRVDSAGFTLRMQKRKTRFEFIAYELVPDVFLARSKEDGNERQLMYELRLRNGIIEIRYRTNGAHLRPGKGVEDSQLLVQKWKKVEEDAEPLNREE